MFDSFANLAGFRRICRVVINLKSDEISDLEAILRKVPHRWIDGVYQFDYKDLYAVLMTSPLAKALCEKQRYSSWDDLISRYLWKVDDYVLDEEEDEW